MTRITSTVFGILCALLLLWAVGCHDDDDNGTDPTEPKDYPVYIGDINLPRIFVYYPVSRRLDSANVDGRYILAASADGSLLYGAGRTSFAIMDTGTFSVVANLPYIGDWSIAVLRDGRMIGITGNDLYILSTRDYSVIFSDTVKCKSGEFSYDCTHFYCSFGASTTTSGETYIVDLSDTLHPVTSRLPAAAGSVLQTVPTHDNSRLLRYAVIQKPLCSFDVYDVQSDSVFFTDYLEPGYGEIALSADGRKAFYTNCGNTSSDYPPAPGTFTVFDIETNTIQDTISGYDYPPVLQSGCSSPPGIMAVTPDGRWLVFLGGGQIGFCSLYLFDLKEHTFVDYVDFSSQNVILKSVTTQLIP